MRFSDISIEKSSLKYMSLFCSYLLISAMFLWGSGVGFASAEEEDKITLFDTNDIDQKTKFNEIFDALSKGSDDSEIGLVYDKENSAFRFSGGELDGISIKSSTLDALSKDGAVSSVSSKTWNDGKLTLKVGGKDRTIDLRHNQGDLKNIVLNKNGDVEYTFRGYEGLGKDSKLIIAEEGVSINALNQKISTDSEILKPTIQFEGIKDKDGKDVHFSLASTLGSSSRTVRYDKDNGFQISVEGNDDKTHEFLIKDPKNGMTFTTLGKNGDYLIENLFPDGKGGGIVEDKSRGLNVDASSVESLLIGNAKSNAANAKALAKLQKNYIYLDSNSVPEGERGRLKGDLSLLTSKEPLSITNTDGTSLKVSRDLVTGSSVTDDGSSNDGSLDKGFYSVDPNTQIQFKAHQDFFASERNPTTDVPGNPSKVDMYARKVGAAFQKDLPPRPEPTKSNPNQGSTPNTKTVESPNLPTPDTIKTIKDGTRTGDPSTGTGAPGGVPPGGFPGGQGIPGGGCGPGGCGPGGAGGADGQTGLKKMLPWLLIIGGGALAAMLLFGGGDDEEDKSADRRRGITNSSQDNKNSDVTTGKAATNPGQSSSTSSSSEDKSSDSGDSSSTTTSCVCDEKGCRDCPNDDCSQCFS